MSKLSPKDKRILAQRPEPRRRNRTVESPWDEVYASGTSGKPGLRSSSAGTPAYVGGSTLALGEVLRVARKYRNDPEKTAAHLCMSPIAVADALRSAGSGPK